MQTSQNTSSQDMNPKLPENEVQAAKKIVESLLLAMKMSSLYPEGHTIYDKAIVQAQNNFDTFFQIQEVLRLDVEKDRLLFGEEVILAGPAEEGNLAFTLFRDGIQRCGSGYADPALALLCDTRQGDVWKSFTN